MLADIVVLNRDIDRQPATELDRVAPIITILGGQVIYDGNA
jgi:predicted amidohydrolase YtcJ